MAMPNMPAPTTNDPQEPEEALPISDQQMVFCSKQATPPKQPNKKMVLKSAKARLKLRRSTPAPPFKGNGRKRFDLSPLPEDKQLCKRIDFGADGSPTTDAPKCKGEIFPATSRHGREATSLVGNVDKHHEAEHQELAIICYYPPTLGGELPVADHISSEVTGAVAEKDNPPHHPTPNDEEW